MWGGREGYETLLNTNIGQELDQVKRFLALVVEYKHKIGFKGPILIEPKPQEPTKHQYDYDVATVLQHLAATALQKDVKLNIEQNHAILAGHTFEHEIALASALGVFGSIDLNRGDYQSGWDTDQFAMNVPGDDAGHVRDPESRRLHHRRHEFRCQDPPPVDRSG
jgi:xylose isomerase